MVTSYSRGHLIVWDGVTWRYADDGSLVSVDRPCVKCSEWPTADGYDACLGHVPGATSACCGHGVEPGFVVYGQAPRGQSSSISQGTEGGPFENLGRVARDPPPPKASGRKELRPVATKAELTKDQRVAKAYRAFRRLTAKMTKDRRAAADGLMRRLAFMQVTLEDLEANINQHGTTEWFSQTEGIEYERERPAARLFNTTFRNYSQACKQLIDLLPAEAAKTEKDALMAFVKGA